MSVRKHYTTIPKSRASRLSRLRRSYKKAVAKVVDPKKRYFAYIAWLNDQGYDKKLIASYTDYSEARVGVIIKGVKSK